MKIKEQTRQLAAGCLKHWFEEIFEEYETKTYSF
ncbi:chlorohydrolase [Streptococcus pneumoniae]|nr:chlorohydrolase [Streptococcus pneumoniae]VOC96495.1 chlorohydrolase [Streptococcus pneumoniae]VOI05488.1 chlorohydrolase [Streptococcus pneumoniae]VQA09751.1 chlorohydrolase [Streptococcus pneumoniae]